MSPETTFEPREALFAKEKGLALIKRLLAQTPASLQKKGVLLVESDPRQHAEVITHASTYQLKLTATNGFILQFNKL